MNKAEYHRILSPEFPDFLEKYIALPSMQRLGGVGLLCGTDWTPLYSNRFWYTRLDHSIGTALITWHFTRDKAQTLASLFHDVATPAFSHASDFRKGDALRQEATEERTLDILLTEPSLPQLLSADGTSVGSIADYHAYPICDNSIPRLSSDRLEYMFPSALALADKIGPNRTWTMDSIRETYGLIRVMKNEDGADELGFLDAAAAEDYCLKFNDVCLALQKCENKLALSLLGDILNIAEERGIAGAGDAFFSLSERELIEAFARHSEAHPDERFSVLFRTFRTMEKIERSIAPIPGAYCVSVTVKKRRIDPLVLTAHGAERISRVSRAAKESIARVMAFEDAPFACAPLAL